MSGPTTERAEDRSLGDVRSRARSGATVGGAPGAGASSRPWVLASVAAVGVALGAGGGYVAKRRFPDETRFLNFDAESTASERLESGWSTFEVTPRGDTFVWCAATACGVSVVGQFQGPQIVRVRVFPFRYRGAPEQHMTFELNGKAVAEVPVPEGQTVVEFLTDADGWRRGKNSLKFRFAYAESPADHSEGSEDSRHLSVAFDWLQIIGR